MGLYDKAILAIETHGALLVFPMKGKKVPSLWDVFYPKHQMVWDWSADGSGRIPKLWHLREELSRSEEVIYVKWYQGRATFFSKTLFTLLLSTFSQSTPDFLKYNPSLSLSYEILMDDSPLPTKELKRRIITASEHPIKNFDSLLKPLWESFLIVGFGEIDEGAYPSLAIGTTKNLHEKLWDASQTITETERLNGIRQILAADSPFLAHY